LVPGAQNPIELHLIVTALAGNPETLERERVTGYESVLRFTGEDFDTAERREHLYKAATASAAFPGLYAPVHVTGLGECLDGGITNDAPIGHALRDCAVSRVLVIANTPAVADPPPPQGIALAEHVAEILVHERLHRDLRSARRRNRQLAALDQLGRRGRLTIPQLAAVRGALGWEATRQIEVIEIRPPIALRGSAFDALCDRALRLEYIAEGRRAAERALARTPNLDRTSHSTQDSPPRQ
jgi:NTE family protein